jgi:hypothetical protein
MQSQGTAGFTGWAILEVFGHRKLGGFVTSTPPEMPGLYRVDVFTDGPDPVATQYYNPSALFALTPTTEDMARRMGRASEIRPVATWELPAPEPKPDRVVLDQADDGMDDDCWFGDVEDDEED